MRKTVKPVPISNVVKILTYAIAILSFAAVCTHVDIVYFFIFIAVLAVALYKEQQKLVIPRRILTIISLAVVAYFALMLDMNSFVSQTLAALLILLGIKLLEEKQIRDYMQIYALSLFLISGLGLLGLGIIFVFIVLLLIFLLSIAFIFLTYYAQDPAMELTPETVKKMVYKCLLIPILAIPLSIILFIILPRSQYPLLDFLNRPDQAKTGFTDKVRLGAVSSIQEDSGIIFRAVIPRLPESDLYWRGITFDAFDGTSWKSTEKRTTSEDVFPHKQLKGHAVQQTIYLEPYGDSHLFALDIPVLINPRRGKRLDDFTLVSSSPSSMTDRRIRYDVMSIVSSFTPQEYIDEGRYLQLPEHLSSSIVSLVKDITGGTGGRKATQLLFEHLGSGRYRYSLKNLPVTKTPIEEFLFHSHYGNCEYFASALTLMLRIAKVPARMVGGYRGGYYNDVGQYYLVPQKNAHVWVEAFLPPTGWVRLDPTPASAETFSPALKGNTFLRISILLDTINYYWYSMVINYNLQKQISIAGTIISGLRKPSITLSFLKKPALTWLFAVIAGAFLLFYILKYFFLNRKTAEEEVLRRFLKKMRDAGYEKSPSQGLEEFTETIEDADLRNSVSRFVNDFEAIFYKDVKADSSQLLELKRMLKKMEI